MSRSALAARSYSSAYDGQYGSAWSQQETGQDGIEEKDVIKQVVDGKYNLNEILATNILETNYWKESLRGIRQFDDIIAEVRNEVQNLEPFLHKSGRTPSTCFCILYKMCMMGLTHQQMEQMLYRSDQHPFVVGMGLLYLRMVADPSTLLEWFEPCLDSQVMIRPGLDKQQVTISDYAQRLLTEMKYYRTTLKRIPVGIEREFKKMLMARELRSQQCAAKAQDNEQYRYKLDEGMEIQAMYRADGKYYASKIIELRDDKQIVIEFTEYGNRETVDIGALQIPEAWVAARRGGGGGGGKGSSSHRRSGSRGSDQRRPRSRSPRRDRRDRRDRRSRSRSRSHSSDRRKRRSRSIDRRDRRRRSDSRDRSRRSRRSRSRDRDKSRRDRRRSRSRDRGARRGSSRSRDRGRRRSRSRSRSRGRDRGKRRSRSRERSSKAPLPTLDGPLTDEMLEAAIREKERNKAVATGSNYARRVGHFTTMLATKEGKSVLPQDGSRSRRSNNSSSARPRSPSPEQSSQPSAEAMARMKKLREAYGDASAGTQRKD